jgi:phosphoglycolate phosphatase-like HAD superfamily hydrolase
VRRLVLFDIDGTLLSCRVSARAFEAALQEVFGTMGDVERYDYSGKTDPQIVRELMRGAGFADPEIDARMTTLLERYRALLHEWMRPELVQPKPGVTELVAALAADARVTLALVTGNIEPNARLKLAPLDLNHRFPFGAFGSDHEHRHRLPVVAVARAREQTGVTFAGKEIVIVGDSIHDVLCGRPLGVRAVGVATGRTSPEALRAVEPDALLPSFADREAAVRAILGLD